MTLDEGDLLEQGQLSLGGFEGHPGSPRDLAQVVLV